MKLRERRKLVFAMVPVAVFAACLFFASAVSGLAQYSSPTSGPLGSVPHTRSQSETEATMEPDPDWGEKRVRAMNVERHKSMVSDTDKLLRLARQLDAEIASNSTDGLTPEELRKLAEIEKLAHNVKAKMAQSFGGGPMYHSLPVPLNGSGRQ